MKEIKFRAWLVGSERMLEDVGFDGSSSKANEVVEYMQYTGLKDKEKQPNCIYDRDILECEDSNSDYPIYADVEWDEDYGRWKATTHDNGEHCEYELWELLQEFQFIKVAGNCFANPELLKAN